MTGAPNAVATLTEYDSLTQTVLQTVYVTKFTKREAGESVPSPTNTAAPFSFLYNGVHRPGGKFTHPTGPPPWISGTWASWTNMPHGRPTGWHRQYSSISGDDDNDYGLPGYTATDGDENTTTAQGIVSPTPYVPSASDDVSAAASVVPVSYFSTEVTPQSTFSSNDASAAASVVPLFDPSIEVTVQSTITVASITMTTRLPSASAPDSSAASAAPEAIPASAFTNVGMNTPASALPLSTSVYYSSTSTISATVAVVPTDTPTMEAPDSSFPTSTSPSPAPSTSSPVSYPSRTQPLTFTVLPMAAPEPTPSPEPIVSTDHAAFRLRARNPFVMLGWMAETETTQS